MGGDVHRHFFPFPKYRSVKYRAGQRLASGRARDRFRRKHLDYSFSWRRAGELDAGLHRRPHQYSNRLLVCLRRYSRFGFSVARRHKIFAGGHGSRRSCNVCVLRCRSKKKPRERSSHCRGFRQRRLCRPVEVILVLRQAMGLRQVVQCRLFCASSFCPKDSERLQRSILAQLLCQRLILRRCCPCGWSFCPKCCCFLRRSTVRSFPASFHRLSDAKKLETGLRTRVLPALPILVTRSPRHSETPKRSDPPPGAADCSSSSRLLSSPRSSCLRQSLLWPHSRLQLRPLLRTRNK